VIALGIVLAVLALGLVVVAPRLDRLTATRAEQAASRYLTEPFGGPARVRVTDRPFLTQALRGVYRNIEVAGELRLGAISGATLAAHLTNVRLPTRELLGGRTREVVCDRVEGRLLLPYDQLAAASKIPGLTLRFSGETLHASAAVPVPGLNQIVRLRGEAVLSSAASGAVWLRVNGVSVVGVAVPSILWNQILPVLNVPIPLPDLPYGLHIDALRPTAAGLVADGSALAVAFRRRDGAAVPGG
jgi:hypothetical protein